MNQNYYQILGLSHHAEDVVIRAAFKLLAHRNHPDKWPENQERANQRMSKINEAYSHLSDSLLNTRYDSQPKVCSNFYQILGVLNDADGGMIDAAYQALTQKYGNAAQSPLQQKRLKEIQQAFEMLGDANKREIYDLTLKTQPFLPRPYQNIHPRPRLRPNNIYRVQQATRPKPPQAPGFLWKIYLAYNVSFWLLIAVIFGLVALSSH